MKILGVELPGVDVTFGRRVVMGYMCQVPLPAIVNGGGAMVLAEALEYDGQGRPLSDPGRLWRRILMGWVKGKPCTLLTNGSDETRTIVWCFQAAA